MPHPTIKRFFFIFLLFVFHASFIAAEDISEVELTSIFGSVEVFLKGSDGYIAAEEGMNLSAGDLIKTGSGSSAELSFNESNTNLLRLGEDTSVKIELLDEEKIEMTEGEVFSSINELPAGSAFEIRTPTAISGARGTDWVTKINEEGTDVEAIQSQPYVRHFEAEGVASRQVTPISQGNKTTVAMFQKPAQFRPIPQAHKQKWQSLKQEVSRRGSEAFQKRSQRPAFNRQEFIRQNQGRFIDPAKFRGRQNRQNSRQGPLHQEEFQRHKEEMFRKKGEELGDHGRPPERPFNRMNDRQDFVPRPEQDAGENFKRPFKRMDPDRPKGQQAMMEQNKAGRLQERPANKGREIIQDSPKGPRQAHNQVAGGIKKPGQGHPGSAGNKGPARGNPRPVSKRR